MIDLSKNANPYYPKHHLVNVIKRSLLSINQYPNKIIELQGKRFFSNFNIEGENIAVSNGTLCAMDLILKTFNAKTIGFYQPTFWGIEYVSEINNYDITKIRFEKNFDYDYEELNKLSKTVDIVYLCNHNNPTLSYLNADRLYSLIKENCNCQYIIDETILVFHEKFETRTMINYIKELNNLTIIISCSKIFNMPGLRIGLIFSGKNNIEKYKKNTFLYSINVFTQSLTPKLLDEFNKLDKIRKKIRINMRNFIKKICNKNIIVSVINVDVSFVLLEINKKIDYNKFIAYLLDNNVKVFPVNRVYFDLKNSFIRVSAGKKYELSRLARLINLYINN